MRKTVNALEQLERSLDALRMRVGESDSTRWRVDTYELIEHVVRDVNAVRADCMKLAAERDALKHRLESIIGERANSEGV